MFAVLQVTGPTDVVYFTLDQGGCWYAIKLEEALDIQNIRCAYAVCYFH